MPKKWSCTSYVLVFKGLICFLYINFLKKAPEADEIASLFPDLTINVTDHYITVYPTVYTTRIY